MLCRPYRPVHEAPPLALFFRDTDLSDAVGFRYGGFADAQRAVDDFMHRLERRVLNRLRDDDDDRILTIVLDGGNAWGGYPDDGRPFLHALYNRLAVDPRLKTVTFSEYLAGNPARGVRAHPLGLIAPVHELATGSWIDEPGSAPGVDLGTWIGEAEENAGWDLLAEARAVLGRTSPAAEGFDRAYEALLAAEGSDWFWWFGSDQESHNDASFDELFRAHLRAAYRAVAMTPPESLDDFIVARPVVWTFAAPLQRIRPRDQVTIRTNCPGTVTFRLDSTPEQVVGLVPVGGVMAGARHFQATIGPFPPSARHLHFRVHCEHPECRRDTVCCAGGWQVVGIRRTSQRTTELARAHATTSELCHAQRSAITA